MSIIDTEAHTGLDISGGAVIMTYTHQENTTIIALARVTLGDAVNPIVGNGGYAMTAKVNGSPVTPISNVAVGITTTAVMQSRHVLLGPGDILTIEADGQAGDTSVNTNATLVNATPVQQVMLGGTGAVPVDHNYGGADALTYETSDGVGVDDAVVRAYLASDYSAGNRALEFVVAQIRTTVGGRWEQAMLLDPADYTLVYYKQGAYGPNTQSLTVTA